MSTPHAWFIGQRVRCTDDSFPRHIVEWCDALPVAGEVYTIRGLQMAGSAVTHEYDLGFLLEEIVNPRNADGFEPGFFHRRFVPLFDEVGESAAKQAELETVS